MKRKVITNLLLVTMVMTMFTGCASQDAKTALDEAKEQNASVSAELDSLQERVKEPDVSVSENVTALVDQINALGEITLDSKDAVSNALIAYNNLSDEEKLQVENLSVLMDAKETYLLAKEADDKAKAEAEAQAKAKTKSSKSSSGSTASSGSSSTSGGTYVNGYWIPEGCADPAAYVAWMEEQNRIAEEVKAEAEAALAENPIVSEEIYYDEDGTGHIRTEYADGTVETGTFGAN